eukprot:scaffold43995_cov28-Tisochrysis_lutea.AAC.1
MLWRASSEAVGALIPNYTATTKPQNNKLTASGRPSRLGSATKPDGGRSIRPQTSIGSQVHSGPVAHTKVEVDQPVLH